MNRWLKTDISGNSFLKKIRKTILKKLILRMTVKTSKEKKGKRVRTKNKINKKNSNE